MAGKVVGAGLRAATTLVYLLAFLCSACILGIYSYYIARLHQHGNPIAYQWRAVEGLAGGSVLYTMFAILLTCFLGGIAFFAFLGMAFDLICCGAMIAIAVLVRHGAHSCNGNTVNTTLGNGAQNATPNGVRLEVVCKLDLVVLIVAASAAVIFAVAFLMQLLINRHHAKEKHIGHHAEEAEGNTEKKRGLFGRRAKTTYEAYDQPEMNTVQPVMTGAATQPVAEDIRNSGFTGSTVHNNNDNYNNDKYESHPAVPALPVQPPIATPAVQETAPAQPAYESTTWTKPAMYDPNATLNTTGPNGFVNSQTSYVPGTTRNY